MGFRDLLDLRRRYFGQAGELVNTFYTPILSQAVCYDRQAGYFDSASLVIAAAGIAAFIHNVSRLISSRQPPMRLISGATWSPADIEAFRLGEAALSNSIGQGLVSRLEPDEQECVRLGLPAGWRPKKDQISQHRLGALAWMIANAFLEVRIALPLDPSGRPYLPGRQGALFHPKSGVLADANGDRISFQGSVNETGAAWARNREKFDVRRSWFADLDAEDIHGELDEFSTIWDRRDPQLLILPLPEAVRRYLDHFQHYFELGERNPPCDPMDAAAVEETPLIDRIQAQWLLDAPKRPENAHLFLEPLWADGQPFQPFPHQDRVARKTVTSFPKSFLFCDEVGLGKTIEGGLALRTLMLRGDIWRALLIAPRGLIRQWMEELREKFALTAWFYDGRCLTDVAGRVRFVAEPLAEDGIVVVSRHLIARADRQAEVGAITKPWDVVIVDEAHAARQRVFGADEPNQFLSLLQDFKRRNLFRGLWLLTATPMQIEPREVHDLMLLCGLDRPEWQPWSTLSAFEQYFRDLSAFGSVRSVRNEVIRLSRIAVTNGAPDFEPRHPPPPWPAFDWENAIGEIQRGRGLGLVLQQLPGNRAEAMTPLLSRQTPLGVFTFRYTRATLRAYQERGLVQGLAVRAPWDAPVDFETSEEHQAYARIDELCSQFYRLADVAPEERSGVGFLMAVFRKRLASSFTAFRKSLERRRDLITNIQQALDEALASEAFKDFAEEEDEDQDGEIDASSAFDRERQRLMRLYSDPRRRGQLERERNYLNDYIRTLNQISRDSKFEVFEERLRNLIESGHRVIVFTQYLDTLDFIRSRLEHRFGDQIGCYSGRGGEVWDPIANSWKVVEKAEIKARSKPDHATPIRILLGTDAASEGLNLQQFSALINYDLPWNPMRVEQRIGRIDRIGQQSERVLIVNLYVRHTIEEDTYDTLKNRIRVFEEVVGPLQPILAEMPRILRRLARGEIELDEARRQLVEAEQRRPSVAIQPFEDYSIVEQDVGERPRASRTALSQKRLAAWCLAHPAPGMQMSAVPEPGAIATTADGTEGCLSIIWPDAPQHLGLQAQEEVLVTFSGEVADRHPPTAASPDDQVATAKLTEGVRLLTWGDPLLGAWLESVRGVPLTDVDYRAGHLTRDTDPFAP